jgi:hypothetical protein
VAQTNNPSDITKKLIALIEPYEYETDKTFAAVYYGLQNLIPKTPAVVVDRAVMDVLPSETGPRRQNTFTVDITIYHVQITKGKQVSAQEADAMAEGLKEYLNGYPRLEDDLVYQAYVSNVSPGFGRLLFNTNDMFQATNLRWTGDSLTYNL